MTSSEPCATAVELEQTDERAHRDRPPGRTITTFVAAATVVGALVVSAAFLRPDPGDVEVAVDEEEPSTTLPEPNAPDPAPIALGAPDDGKDSVGLPVSAEPSTGLVDGQTVTISGSGFPPGEQIGVVMCTREAGAEHGGRGVDACNIGHFAQGTSDQQGTVSIEFEVRRLAMLDGQEVDCASEPGRCIIGMGMISDYDQSGGVAVDFDPSVPLPEPPVATLAQTGGIADGQVVDATVTGLRPDGYLSVQLCTENGFRCAFLTEAVADDDGIFEGGIRLWRTFGAWPEPGSSLPPNVDCAVESCFLQFQADASGREVPRMPVSFDPERGGRVAPTVQLVDSGPYANGDSIELLLDGVAPGSYLDLQVCTTGDPYPGLCVAFSGGQYDGSGTLSTQLQVEDQGFTDPCGGGCVLKVATYSESHDGTPDGPPPLFPEPIPIELVT